ncbi:MAG: hypothetical protein AAF750_00525 [Planctomycetota bacterium]
MADFITACTQSPTNLVLSVLLVLIMLYWIVVIIGAVGMDSLDFDFDFDGDVDLALDGHTSLFGAGIGLSFLRFFHVGTVPLLILVSVFVLMMWAIGVISYPLIGNWGILLQLLMLVPFAIGAILLTKVLTLPLRVFFDKLKAQEAAEQSVNLIGQRCEVVSLTATHRHGQVKVATDGSPLLLNVVTPDESITLNKGDEAVLISQDADSSVFTIQGF